MNQEELFHLHQTPQPTRRTDMGKNDPPKGIPPPTPQEDKKAEDSVKDWLKDKGYPSPDPKDQ